ncbi:EI24 domain-containing protein, partial [Shewanella sp. 0m-11]
MNKTNQVQKKSGVNYFLDGFRLIKQPGLRRFVFIPLSINLLLFGSLVYFAIGQLESVFAWLSGQLPDYLSWLNFILWPLA